MAYPSSDEDEDEDEECLTFASARMHLSGGAVRDRSKRALDRLRAVLGD